MTRLTPECKCSRRRRGWGLPAEPSLPHGNRSMWGEIMRQASPLSYLIVAVMAGSFICWSWFLLN